VNSATCCSSKGPAHLLGMVGPLPNCNPESGELFEAEKVPEFPQQFSQHKAHSTGLLYS
jgi:hypothetical protein